MVKKSVNQSELVMDAPAAITQGEAGDPNAIAAALIDDTPDVVRMDLRKFNKTKQKVSLAVAAIKGITVINNKDGVDKMMVLLKDADGVGKLIEDKRKALGDPYRLEAVRINEYVKDLVKDLPGALQAGKALILAYHKAEEKKAKVKRYDERVAFLVLSGYKEVGYDTPDGFEVLSYCDLQGNSLLQTDVMDFPDDLWNKRIQEHQMSRNQKIEVKLADLEKLKEGADFFGDDAAVAEISEKIAEVKSAPAPAVSHGYGSYVAPSTKGLTKRWAFEVTSEQEIPRAYLQVNEKAVREAIAAGARSIPGVRIYQDESISLR